MISNQKPRDCLCELIFIKAEEEIKRIEKVACSSE